MMGAVSGCNRYFSEQQEEELFYFYWSALQLAIQGVLVIIYFVLQQTGLQEQEQIICK